MNYSEHQTELDQAGQLVRKSKHNSEGRLAREWMYEHDSEGQLARSWEYEGEITSLIDAIETDLEELYDMHTELTSIIEELKVSVQELKRVTHTG